MQNLTESHEKAKRVCGSLLHALRRVGREDILNNPTVLDIGGGMGEFSKHLNEQGVHYISLDQQDLTLVNTKKVITIND